MCVGGHACRIQFTLHHFRGDAAASDQSTATDDDDDGGGGGGGAPVNAPVIKDEDLASLAAMGFDTLLAHAALVQANGVLRHALQILLN